MLAFMIAVGIAIITSKPSPQHHTPGTVPAVSAPTPTGPLCDSNGAPCTDTQLQHVRDNCGQFAKLGYTCK